MKQTAIILIVLGTLFAGSLSAQADSGNPFGFETDKHPLKYEYCQKEKDPKKSGLRGHGYKCSSAPRPHPDFQEYFLLFVEDVGLCSIQAASNAFSGRGQVAPAEEKFEMFKGQIAKKYGPPTSKDTEQTNGRSVASPKTPAPEMQSRKEHTNGPRVTPPKTSRPKHEESGVATKPRTRISPELYMGNAGPFRPRENKPVQGPPLPQSTYRDAINRFSEQSGQHMSADVGHPEAPGGVRRVHTNMDTMGQEKIMQTYNTLHKLYMQVGDKMDYYQPGLLNYYMALRNFIAQQKANSVANPNDLAQQYGVSLPDYHWSPKAGFKGLGNVKAIHLMARPFKRSSKVINLTFRLLTSDACQKKIDDKAEHAF